MKVLLASNNKNKLREIKAILGDFFDIVSLEEAGVVSDPEENGKTFEDNARIKALAGMRASNMPCIADDSGLEVDALGGEPGVYSARYAGENATSEERNAKLLRNMADVEDRSARFVSVICMEFPDGREIVARGYCHGQITYEAAGQGGFGYDPLFYVPEKKMTFAELSAEEKNKISHRAMSLKEFKRIWENEYDK